MIGKIFSHYETLEHVGDNELGALYLARDLSRNMTVRLLLLPLDLDDESRRACLDNLRLVAELGKDHLDQILGFGESDGGQVFISTPDHSGERTLEEQLRPVAGLPPAGACGIARQVAEGLIGLHGADLIHGFLRPGLILSPDPGLVTLAYPGLGGCIAFLRVKGRCEAAIHYRAPEQLLGTPIDARADVWALGVILYEMITRRLPFQGMSDREISKAILEMPHPRAWEGDRVHPDLEKILNRALAKRPEDRYQEISEMLADLTTIEHELLAAKPVSPLSEIDHQGIQGAPPEALIGRTVSHFEIVEQIGGGGMGVVYRAKDLRLDRSVALKFLSWKSPQGDGKIQRFIQEAKAASALDHPNICTIHAIEEAEDGTLFIAMALYQGETLTEKISRGTLPVSEIVDLGLQICAGLSAAHGRGIIHRDIKPANLMVTQDGVVKILDFGLSKFSADGADASHPSGPVMGTVDYMAPEQALGKDATQQTDIWALGVVLFEMATGKRPFPGSNQLSILFNIVHTDPKELEETAVLGIPVELGWIIRRALTKDNEKRYQDIEELRADLLALQQPDVPGGGSSLGHLWQTRRWLVVAGASLLLMLTAAVFWLVVDQWSRQGSTSSSPQAEEVVVEWAWADSVETYGFESWRAQALAAIVTFDLERSGVRMLSEDSTDPKLREASSFRVEAQLELAEDQLCAQASVEDLKQQPGLHQVEACGEELIDEAIRFAAALRELMGLPDRASLGLLQRASGEEQRPELEQVNEARERLLLRDARAAGELLTEAVKLEPRNAMTRALLAEALALTGDVRGSREEIAEAVRLAGDLDLDLEQQLFFWARYLESERRTTESTAILLALRALDSGTQFQSTHERQRFHQEAHLALILAARSRQSELALEILRALEEQGYADDPLVASVEAEAVRWQDASKLLVTSQQAIDQAERFSSPFLKARALLLKSEALRNQRQPVQAQRALEEALKIYHEHNDDFGEANTLTSFALLFWDQQDLANARVYWERAEAIFDTLEDEFMLARLKGNRAVVINQLGDLALAAEVYGEAIGLNQRMGDWTTKAINLANMADPLMAMGKFAEARESCEKAIELFNASRKVSSQKATVLMICSELEILTGNLAEANRLVQEASEILETVDDSRQLAKLGFWLGRLRYYQGIDVASAVAAYRQSLEFYEEMEHLTQGQGRLHWGLGTALMAQGRLEEARVELDRAKELQPTEILRKAEAELSLAEIALEEGRAGVAEVLVTGILGDLQQNGAVLDESRAHVLLARSFIDRDQLTEAQSHLEMAARALGDVDSPVYRLPLEIAESRLWLARDETRSRANDKLQEMYKAAVLRSGFHEWELETRLLLAAVMLETDQQETACARLPVLEKSATEKGYSLLAGQASELHQRCD